MDPSVSGSMVNGAAAGGQLAYSAYQSKQNQAAISANNQANRNHDKDLYRWARRDALSDRQFENDYNSPTQQMKRLKEAGLNPRLIYGGGSAQMGGAATRNTSVQNTAGQAPIRDISSVSAALKEVGSVIGNFMELQNLQAQTDNTRETRELIREQTAATRAGINLTDANTNTANYNLDYLKRTENLRTDAQKADIKVKLEANDRAANLQAAHYAKLWAEVENINSATDAQNQNVAKSREEVENLAVIRDNLRKEGTLREMEIVMRKYGINPNAEGWQNSLRKILNNKDLMSEIWQISEDHKILNNK